MVFIPHSDSKDSPEKGAFRFRRSVLFMPSSNERALKKAPGFSCDSVIFDLEDAVSEDERPAALTNLRSLVKGVDFGVMETVVRTSDSGCTNFTEDMEIAIECGVDAILLPKVETIEGVTTARQMLAAKGSDAVLWAMIETPLALMNLKEITQAGCLAGAGQLKCLVVGPNDLAKSTGVSLSGGRTAMHSWMMQVVAAARASGMSVLDGVYNNFRDLEGFARECIEGAVMGFDGKTLIHPAQIEAANTAFGPSSEEIERAGNIIAAFAREENIGKGAIQINGEMIERLHLEQAECLLSINEKS